MNSKENTYKVNLADYRVEGSKVFTGRDRGEDVRKRSKIDYEESTHDTVLIIVPDDIYSINPSFLEEFFVNVVIKLGKDKFFSKFRFEGSYNIERPLNEAINRILRNKTALG